jgi:hypothetical protein
MEYFIGSVITFVLMLILIKITRSLPVEKNFKIEMSQSHFFNLIGKYVIAEELSRRKPTQSSKYISEAFLKILIVKNKAYWIKDNVFYVADIVNKEVDKATAREVDIMAMDKVQLKEAMFIIDKLKEDSYNDNWNAG